MKKVMQIKMKANHNLYLMIQKQQDVKLNADKFLHD